MISVSDSRYSCQYYHSSHFHVFYPRYLVVSATIAIFAVENRENGLCIDSQN